MSVFTHPLSRTAGDLFDQAIARMGVTRASFWMFAGNDELDGFSPLQAIKSGRADDVRRILEDRKCS